MKRTFLTLTNVFFCVIIFAQSSPNLLRSIISNSGISIQTDNKFIVQQSVGQISPISLKKTNEHTVK